MTMKIARAVPQLKNSFVVRLPPKKPLRPVPKVIPFTDRPLSYKIAFVAGSIIGAPVMLATRAIGTAWQTATWVAKKVADVTTSACSSMISTIHSAVSTFFSWTNQKVLVPIKDRLASVLDATYNKAVLPVARTIGAAAQKAFAPLSKYVLSPVGQAISRVAKPIFVDAPRSINQKAIQPLFSTIASGASLAYSNVLAPTAQTVAQVASNAISCVRKHVAKPILDGAKFAADMTMNAVNQVASKVSNFMQRLFYSSSQPIQASTT